MTRTSGGTYLATIPGQAKDRTVQFYVTGTDDAERDPVRTRPEAPNLAHCSAWGPEPWHRPICRTCRSS